MHSSHLLVISLGHFVFARDVDVDVDAGWNGESKGLGHPLQIQPVHVKDVLVRVTGIRVQVAAVSIACTLVQVKVLLDQAFQLRLHVGNLVGGELVLVQRDLGMLQITQEAQFRW